MSSEPEPRGPEGSGSDQPHYVGLVTRTIGFVLDAAVINLVAIVVALGVALVLSLLHLPKGVRTVIAEVGGGMYILWTIGYFVGFWSATGQTPGSRVMEIRVVPTRGEELKPRRAFLRLIGLVLAALPLCVGYVMVLFDSRRRGLQDRLARTLVIETPTHARPKRRRGARTSSQLKDDSGSETTFNGRDVDGPSIPVGHGYDETIITRKTIEDP